MARQSSGLRERKKERTRNEILRVAGELFAERGYEATTIAEIAQGVDIAPSTVVGYFPTKDAIFFSGLDQILDDYKRSFVEWSAVMPPLEAIRRWHVERLPALTASMGEYDEQMHYSALVATTPTLQALFLARMASLTDTLAQGFATALEDGPRNLRPRIIASCVNAAMTEAMVPWGEEPGLNVPQLIDYALGFIEGGIERLGSAWGTAS